MDPLVQHNDEFSKEKEIRKLTRKGCLVSCFSEAILTENFSDGDMSASEGFKLMW